MPERDSGAAVSAHSGGSPLSVLMACRGVRTILVMRGCTETAPPAGKPGRQRPGGRRR